MIKVFTTNKNGKIELDKDELKKLLDEAYWEGYHANNHYVYSTPTWQTPFTITCSGTDATINASDISGKSVTFSTNTTVTAPNAVLTTNTAKESGLI